MRCLYCGKQLPLFRRLTGGGEFCSDAHKASYHDEFNRLALARLKQAQEKSDELRAAAPQNQLALIRKGAGEPSGPTIRSNAHWIESKAGKAQPRTSSGAGAPAPAAERPDPKQAGFISSMPGPVQPAQPEPPANSLDPVTSGIPTSQPEWNAVLVPLDPPLAGVLDATLFPRTAESKPLLPAASPGDLALITPVIQSAQLEWNPPVTPTQLPQGAPVEAGLFPLASSPAKAQPDFPVAGSSDLVAIPAAIASLKPEWNPPVAANKLSAAGYVESTILPQPHEHAAPTDISVPPQVEMTTLDPSVPSVVSAPPPLAAYASLPAIQIDPIRFAPAVDGQVEARSQFLPLRFDFTAYSAPDFGILEPPETPLAHLKVRPHVAPKRTEQAHALDPPLEPVQPARRRAAQVLEMGVIGEIAALANPALSFYPKLATPADTRIQADELHPKPPATVMPRSASLAFRPNDKVSSAAVSDDQDDKRPSTLKVKLAAMAPPITPPSPKPEPAKPGPRAAVAPGRAPERKPVERSATAEPARILPTPRRRTVAIPSILELPDPGEEHKSLWGALRKYLGK